MKSPKATKSPKVKLAISLRADVVAKVKRLAAEKRTKSVSAYIEHAVTAQLASEVDFDALLAELLQQAGGPPTAKERARAAKILRGAA